METIKIPQGITKDINATPENKKTSIISSLDFGSDSSSSNSGSWNLFSSSSSDSNKTEYMRIGLIIIILLFLGANVFTYLGDFLDKVKEISSPLLAKILGLFGLVVSDTVNVAAEGVKLGADVAAGTVTSGVDVIEGQLDQDSNNETVEEPTNNSSNNSSNKTGGIVKPLIPASLSTALDNAEQDLDPMPDDSTSSTQMSKKGKSGFCYIGEDRGFRSCVSVKDSDVCMSGKIFPSKDICVNPSLRE